MDSIQLILLLLVCVGLVYFILKNRRNTTSESGVGSEFITRRRLTGKEVEAEMESKELHEITEHRSERIHAEEQKMHNLSL